MSMARAAPFLIRTTTSIPDPVNFVLTFNWEEGTLQKGTLKNIKDHDFILTIDSLT